MFTNQSVITIIHAFFNTLYVHFGRYGILDIKVPTDVFKYVAKYGSSGVLGTLALHALISVVSSEHHARPFQRTSTGPVAAGIMVGDRRLTVSAIQICRHAVIEPPCTGELHCACLAGAEVVIDIFGRKFHTVDFPLRSFPEIID